MSACSIDGDSAGMAKIASDLYPKAMSGDNEAQLNLLDVVSSVNNNIECSGHDQYVKDVASQVTGPLALDLVVGTGKRPGYPRLDEEKTVAELHIPPFENLLNSNRK